MQRLAVMRVSQGGGGSLFPCSLPKLPYVPMFPHSLRMFSYCNFSNFVACVAGVRKGSGGGGGKTRSGWKETGLGFRPLPLPRLRLQRRLRILFPCSQTLANVPLFPSIFCQCSLVPQNPWETLSNA